MSDESAKIHNALFSALQQSYLALLRIPVGSPLRDDRAMARCRDAIAFALGDDSENVQNRYEYMARTTPKDPV